MLSGRLSFISQGAKPGVMSVGASIKGSGRGGSGRGDNEWLYVFGFATHILLFKTIQPIGKTDIYNVLPTGGCTELD